MSRHEHQRVSSGSPFEHILGISRGVKAGGLIALSGTAALDENGKTVGVGDPKLQAQRALAIIQKALRELGADIENVYRTRTLLTRIEDWEIVGRVHGEFFRDVRPANTVMQVSRFIDPDWLVEFEVDALLP